MSPIVSGHGGYHTMKIFTKAHRPLRSVNIASTTPISMRLPHLRRRIVGVATLAAVALFLGACGTTQYFRAHPKLTVMPISESPQSAVSAIFSGGTPFYISLCNADQATGECLSADTGITAKGVGGFFLPLKLHVRGIRVSAVHETPDGTTFVGAFDSKVDSIAPSCHSSRGKTAYNSDGSLSLQFKSFYCNWAVVGNVFVNAELSINSISVKDRVFTGFYRITFHGTGNAAGSGYFRAAIGPVRHVTAHVAAN